MRRILLFGAALGFAVAAGAHPGPEHEIEEINELIAIEGESPDLLIRRAIEFQVLGKLSDAEKDLERALRLENGHPGALRELGRVYFDLGKTNEALQTVSQAMAAAGQPPEKAALLVTRAQILMARGENSKALHDLEEAIKEHPSNVEWYLLRSRLHARLKLKKERVRGLEQGLKETGSGVVMAEWIDALVDDGQFAPALQTIEAELKESRWQSSWLLRRGKVRLLSGEPGKAEADFRKALEELNARMKSASPDAALLADRGLAYDLLGDARNARSDYERAIERGMAEDWIRERLRVLKGKE